MGSSTRTIGKMLEMFEVGPCNEAYKMGFMIGQRFSQMIKSRLSKDLILQNQLLPFALSAESQPLITALSNTNKNKFPRYWDELLGTAEGSGVPVLHLMLLNFRKEILPFLPTEVKIPDSDAPDDCSDVLVASDCMALVVHNEDANIALVGHTYLIKATLSDGLTFTAYTYAGELPSCAFGFNSNGIAFTLDSVPPLQEEIMAGGIGRNFISRDLLEATSLDDALHVWASVSLIRVLRIFSVEFIGLFSLLGLQRIRSAEVSVGHSYNLVDIGTRKILNVETASRNRVSVHIVGETPFFHANMYLHLQVKQVQDENSISRKKRADQLPKQSKTDFLRVLGDTEDEKFPIYMNGPTLYTLCTAVIDLDEQTVSIIQGNPGNREVCHIFPMTS